MDFKVSTARNGQEAFEKVKQTMDSSKQMFDLVILDLNMPIADGYEACTNILQLFSQESLLDQSDISISPPPRQP